MNSVDILEQLKIVNIQADIFFQKNESHSIQFENDKFNSISSKNKQGYGLRALNNNLQQGFISFSKYDNTIMDKIKYLCSMGEKVRYEYPYFFEKETDKASYFDNINTINPENIIPQGYEMLDSLKKNNPSYQYSINFSYGDFYTEVHNSLNSQYKKYTSYFLFNIYAMKASESSITQLSENFFNKKYTLDYKNIIKDFNQSIEYSMLPFMSISTGKYQVVFNPSSIGAFSAILLSGFNGSAIKQGVSTIPKKEGKIIACDNFSIYNDGFQPEFLESSIFDSEGVESPKMSPLIKKGVCFDGFYDLKTASEVNKRSTGNGLRSSSALPFTGLRNVIIDRGSSSIKDIISSMDNGIYIDQLVGAGMSNVLAGELSASIGLGYLVQKGKIVGKIKNAMLNANVFEMILKIQAISEERKQTANTLYPYILFDNIHIIV